MAWHFPRLGNEHSYSRCINALEVFCSFPSCPGPRGRSYRGSPEVLKSAANDYLDTQYLYRLALQNANFCIFAVPSYVATSKITP